MDELKIVIFRQNEVLRKLETTLSNVISRIESIERLFYNTERSEWSDNCLPMLPKKNDYGLLEIDQHEPEDLTKEIDELDFNAINSAFNLVPIDILKIDYVNRPINLTEDKNDQNSHLIEDKNNIRSVTLFNSKLHDSVLKKNYDHHQLLEKLPENRLENIYINTASKLPALETKDKSENFECEAFQKNNENNFCALNNKLLTPGLRKNEFESDQKLYSKEALKFMKNKLDSLKKCFNSNKSAMFPSCIGKSALNITSSNQLYIFDEEDNSSMRLDEPLDLEIAENEFYYLKGHIKRGSTVTRDYSQNSGLDNCHLFKCLYPTARETKQESNNNYKFGIYLNSQIIQTENNKCSIKEIKYHKPFEKIVGYVQIPYSAFLSQPFESSDEDQTNKDNVPLKKVKYLDSHSIYNETRNFFEANIFGSGHDQYDRQFTYIKGHYPIFYQFFCFRRYPILFLRPLFSNQSNAN